MYPVCVAALLLHHVTSICDHAGDVNWCYICSINHWADYGEVQTIIGHFEKLLFAVYPDDVPARKIIGSMFHAAGFVEVDVACRDRFSFVGNNQ